MNQNQEILFIVGDYESGKSTLIRSLTGSCRNKVVNVQKLSGLLLRAFVSLSAPQELGQAKHPPCKFPSSIENKYNIKRNDWDILISALELKIGKRRQMTHGYEQYIQSVLGQGFKVGLAVIENSWDNKRAPQYELSHIQNLAKNLNINIIIVDTSNDPNETANGIRHYLYPY